MDKSQQEQELTRDKRMPVCQIIELITVIIALVTAIFSLFVGINNNRQIEDQKGIVQRLMDAKVSDKLNIISPIDGETIKTSVFTKMFGTYGGTLPKGYTLWVFARNSTAYYLQGPQVSFHPINKQWSQSNILLDEYGMWELHFCMANESATQWANERLARNIDSGVSVLPDGFASIDKRIINRE